ncbi:polysaccharide deacetylase family protein [Leadbetterella sp. DM7]|uniref:polysaccharide deacetylase family protein n=1 Tax=Leadbetterella sp. DM7 TaxID=3235085 RepID=UPI00349E9C6E
MNRIFELIYPRFLWRMPATEKCIYLTFDDGPVPEVTPWVLEQLEQFNAKATFFCVGDNIRKNPGTFQQVISAGHGIGNHTYNHLNGWKTPVEEYLGNMHKLEELYATRLFRPPYGRIKKAQARQILLHHRIVMWSVLTRDYSASLSPEKCLKNAIRDTRNGSIVLFHDSLKAQNNLRHVLPRYLGHFSRQGYRFEKLPG